MYIKPITIASFDVDRNGNAKVSALMRYFQQIARENIDQFGMTYDFLRQNNIVFVLTKYKIKIHDKILSDCEYIFKTAPCAIHGISFIRDFLIEDKNRKIVAEASSTWIIIDYINRSILRPNKLPKEIPPCDKLVDFIPERIRTNVLEGDLCQNKMTDYQTKVSYTLLDQNNHLNKLLSRHEAVRFKFPMSGAINYIHCRKAFYSLLRPGNSGYILESIRLFRFFDLLRLCLSGNRGYTAGIASSSASAAII